MTPPGTVNVADQAKLLDYLNNHNGNLYIESTKLGYDHTGTSLLAHFGIKFHDHGEAYEVNQVTSDNDNLMNNVNFVYAGGNSPHYLVDRLVSNGAEILYTSEDGYHRMFAHNPGSSYKVVSSSVLMGALKNADSLSSKPYLMAEIVNYFLGIETTTSISELFGKKDQQSVVAYPNPFSQQTSLSFNFEKESSVMVNIMDVSGSVIRKFAPATLYAGEHSLVWDGKNDAGSPVKSGIYFYQVNIDGVVRSGKLILNR